MERLKCLVFQHVDNEHLGHMGSALEDRGVEVTVVNFAHMPKNLRIASYPVELANFLIVLGGSMGVSDSDNDYPSKAVELATIWRALDKGIPILGICLGSQLLAHALRAKVYPNKYDGYFKKEIGFYGVSLTEEGKSDPILKGFTPPVKVLQWHGDAFDLPEGAKLLATSPLCKHQAFRYNNAYGFLFHFEFTPEMVARQIEEDRDWIHTDFEIDEEKLLAEAQANASLMEQQSQRLFNNFMEVVRGGKL